MSIVVPTIALGSVVSVLISVIALIVAIIALAYTARTFWLKQGVQVRGSYTLVSSVSCEDKYVGSLTLENLKDRAVVIFKVYLRLTHGVYLELEDFEDSPLILRPFEVYSKTYDPIEMYSESMTRVRVNNLLEDHKVKKRLVLATSEGRYIVQSWIKHWDPVYHFFQNHLTAIIRPIRATYKGRSYGGNAKYIVEFQFPNEKVEVVPIYPRDYTVEKFRKFRLTQESLDSKEALETYLRERMAEGALDCNSVEVHEMESWRREAYKDYKRIIDVGPQNWFVYHVMGRFVTILDNWRLRRENRRRPKEQKRLRGVPEE